MDFVIIANAWTAANDNPTGKHQIALQLAKKGHRVLWIEGSGMRRPSATKGADRSRILSKIKKFTQGIRKVKPDIWKVAPLIIPLPNNAIARMLNAMIYTVTGTIGGWLIGLRRPTLINFLPVVPLTEKLWRGRTVYFCVDLWSQFDMYDSNMMDKVDRLCCHYADCVLTTSLELQNRCKKKNTNTHLIGHGVNWETFRAPLLSPSPTRPTDMPAGRVVGFFGLLSEWVDQELLVNLAQTLLDSKEELLQKASIVLIGRADVDIAKLKAQPNIKILGAKPFATLPDYTAFFDVAIIPFVVNDLTKAVNPIKLREMLAAGCSVVSTDLPEVTNINNDFVTTTGNPDAFTNAVIKKLQASPYNNQQRIAISDSVQSETWDAKVELMLKTITPNS